MSAKLAVDLRQKRSTFNTSPNNSTLDTVNLQDWALEDEAQERLRFLNQGIADMRAQLDAVEEWDFYESAALKYKIIVYIDERSRMAADFQRKTERKIRDAAEEAWKIHGPQQDPRKVDVLRDEIDWVNAKIRELVSTLRTASTEEKAEIREVIKSYKKYWEELMIDSGRIRRSAKREAEDDGVYGCGHSVDNSSAKASACGASPRTRKRSRARRTSEVKRPIDRSLEILSLLTTLAALK